MSKKLIASAAAAALALAGLVAIPTAATANPGPFQVTVTGWETTNTVGRTGATSTSAIQVFVPSNDVLRSVDTNANAVPAGSSTALRLAVRTPGATDAITATATGGVELLTKTQWDATTAPTTATGTQSLTVNAATGLADIYAYTTSTTAGTVVISAAGSSQTIHVQGLSPMTNMYKLAFTGPASAAISGTIAITGTVRDMFDNILRPTAAQLAVTTLGGSVNGAVNTLTDYAVAAATGVISFTVPSSTTASNVAVSISPATGLAASAVTAFPGRNVNSFFTVNAVNLAAQITALEAQVAALTAQLQATVTKAKYNKLVRKWNRANPNNKVKRVS